VGLALSTISFFK
jgi:hypothetical protein